MSVIPEEQVILVDDQDCPIGTLEKMEAHRRGALHRAFSVFVFDGRGELVLQRRAAGKYHCPRLWSNTCCSHPRPGEDVVAAARRRLREEMGLECPLHPAFSFVYRAEFANGLTEHEFDHVLIGTTDAPPAPNPKEVESVRRTSLEALAGEIERDPGAFTPWLRLCLPRVIESRRSAAAGVGGRTAGRESA